MKIHPTVLILVFSYVSLLGAAVPFKRQSSNSTDLPPLIPSRTQAPFFFLLSSSYDPEAKDLQKNGPLPEGTETKGGMALNAASYPNPVASQLIAPHGPSIRKASAQEIDTLKHYNTLSSAAYCRTVIPGGQWDCPHCDKMKDLTIVKTFKTLLFDTNALVARGDREKTIYVVFRGE